MPTEIEKRIKAAKKKRAERYKKEQQKKKEKSQEGANAADVKEEVERQLAAVKDKAEDEAIAAGFSCEVVDSEDEEEEKAGQDGRIIEIPAPRGRFKYYLCPNCDVWIAPSSFCGRCRWVAPPPDKENVPPPNVEVVSGEEEVEAVCMLDSMDVQCEPQETDVRVIVDDVVGLITTDQEYRTRRLLRLAWPASGAPTLLTAPGLLLPSILTP